MSEKEFHKQLKFILLGKKSQRNGNHSSKRNINIHKDGAPNIFIVKQTKKKKKSKRDTIEQKLSLQHRTKETSDTSPLPGSTIQHAPLRQSFKQKKGKNKLSGILNISSAQLAVKGSNFKNSLEKQRESFHLEAIVDRRVQQQPPQSSQMNVQKSRAMISKKQTTLEDYICNQKLIKASPHLTSNDSLIEQMHLKINKQQSSGQYKVS